jgi:aminoglycoside phosphotransferase family enzyme
VPPVDTPAADLLIEQLDVADGPVERVETHISTLVFQNGWAYKIKRPVRYKFVDLSTREMRRRICEAELEQNRRFAPDVYDSLVPIHDSSGVEVDCAVRRHRMPADRRLSTLVDRNGRHAQIVDGHGDLLANDIFCLDDGPRILDCLEFDARLRFGDVLADVAFLVMDFERLGRRPYDIAHPSDATVEIAAHMAAGSTPWVAACVIDTSVAVDRSLKAAMKVLA